MKTELLVQMDGLAKSDDLVFLLAASNIPWCVVCISAILKGFLSFYDDSFLSRSKLSVKGLRPFLVNKVPLKYNFHVYLVFSSG